MSIRNYLLEAATELTTLNGTMLAKAFGMGIYSKGLGAGNGLRCISSFLNNPKTIPHSIAQGYSTISAARVHRSHGCYLL